MTYLNDLWLLEVLILSNHACTIISAQFTLLGLKNLPCNTFSKTRFSLRNKWQYDAKRKYGW